MAADDQGFFTNWQGLIVSTLVPVTIAAGFIYQALIPGWRPSSETWIWGLFLLVPLEFIRALILSFLSDAYKTSSNPMQAVQSFLLSIAILFVLGIVYLIFEGGISDALSLLAEPFLYKLLGLPILIMVIDGVIGILSFGGDPRGQATRLNAIADDSIDWLSLAIFRLPFVIAPLYGLLAWASSAGWRIAAWVPGPSEDLAVRVGLFYLACYFLGKAVLVAYVQTANFAQTGKRLLDVPWMRWVRGNDNEKRQRFEGRDNEAESAEDYKYSKHSKSVLHFEDELIQSLKDKSGPSAPRDFGSQQRIGPQASEADNG